jgi:hypothetical protein
MATTFRAVLAAEPPPSVYKQACTTIQNYVGWIESQSMPSNSGGYANWSAASSTLTQLKTDAMNWVNQIFPNTLQLPSTFAVQGKNVTSQLNTLVALVAQLSNAGSQTDALLAQIGKLVQGMLPEVSNLQKAASALSASLAGFSEAMVRDLSAAANEQTILTNDLRSEENIVAQAQGQLQHERHKSCPNSGTINGLNDEINRGNQQAEFILQLMKLFGKAAADTSQCSQALKYLANYWQVLAADVQGCQQALQIAVSKPKTLAQFDLSLVQSQWSQTLTFLQQAGTA